MKPFDRLKYKFGPIVGIIISTVTRLLGPAAAKIVGWIITTGFPFFIKNVWPYLKQAIPYAWDFIKYMLNGGLGALYNRIYDLGKKVVDWFKGLFHKKKEDTKMWFKANGYDFDNPEEYYQSKSNLKE